jgi:hypothetical protein
MKKFIIPSAFLALGIQACTPTVAPCNLSNEDSMRIYSLISKKLRTDTDRKNSLNFIQFDRNSNKAINTEIETCSVAQVWIDNYQSLHPSNDHSFLIKVSELTNNGLLAHPYLHFFLAQKTKEEDARLTLVITALKADGHHFYFGAENNQVLEHVYPCPPCTNLRTGARVPAPTSLECPL